MEIKNFLIFFTLWFLLVYLFPELLTKGHTLIAKGGSMKLNCNIIEETNKKTQQRNLDQNKRMNWAAFLNALQPFQSFFHFMRTSRASYNNFKERLAD